MWWNGMKLYYYVLRFIVRISLTVVTFIFFKFFLNTFTKFWNEESNFFLNVMCAFFNNFYLHSSYLSEIWFMLYQTFARFFRNSLIKIWSINIMTAYSESEIKDLLNISSYKNEMSKVNVYLVSIAHMYLSVRAAVKHLRP